MDMYFLVLMSWWFYWFNRDADKTIYERLQKEFEAARALQTQGIFEKRAMLGIPHLYTTLCTTSLIVVEPTNTMGLTSFREVVHNVVYKCGMTSIFVEKKVMC